MVNLKVKVNFRFRSKKSKVVGPNTLFIEFDNFRISGGETEAPRLQSPQDFQEASEVLLPGQDGVGGDWAEVSTTEIYFQEQTQVK